MRVDARRALLAAEADRASCLRRLRRLNRLNVNLTQGIGGLIPRVQFVLDT